MHRGEQEQLRGLTEVKTAGSDPLPAGSDPLPPVDLTPFVPRIVPEWIADAPQAVHRAIDGTLVFTDLSGFTAMSERLASLGKVGAEELTDHLDTIFTELITVAGGMGGSLLKFGGDALLILFWGEGHETRAARAAVDMQATLHRIGVVDTSAGEARLEMTVGAHAGTFDFFLAGDGHRALFVCGQDAATTCRIEASAAPGEVRVSPELAGRLDPRLLADRTNHYPLLVRGPDVRSDVAPDVRAWPEGATAASFVPVMLRDHLSGGIETTEHRQMAVGFVHLSNVDDLILELGPQAAARHLDEVVRVVQGAFAEHEVAFISTDIYDGGPKIVCAAGAVRTFENDEERILRALRQIAETDGPVDVRIGVNRGHGFCGYVGPSFRRTFAVIGDVVNTAARVMAKARPGEVLATSVVIDRSDTVFQTTELEPFAAKGKAEPLVAHRVGPIVGTRERTQQQIPLVGRAAEVVTIANAITDVRAGRGRFVEIVGEPGIGKTRVVKEALENARDLRVSTVRSGRYAASTPYFPFRALTADIVGDRTIGEVGEIVGSRAPDIAPYLPLIALAIGLEVEQTPEIARLPAEQWRKKLNEVVVATVRTLLEEPVVWFLDDTHWLDSGSKDLLSAIAGAVEDLPLLVCSARRPGDDPVGDTVIELAPLPDDDAASVLRAATDRHLLPNEVEHLSERARGNPLYLIELAAVMSEGRDLERLPDSLEAVLATRIDSLAPADRHVLRQLAVVGSRSTLTVVEEAIEGLRPDVWHRLSDFIDIDGAEWRFAQSLVRETAYEGLSFRERRDVHGRTARALERFGDPDDISELLSLHFHSAAMHHESLDYSNRAAAKAKRAFAAPEAAVFLARSVDSARALSDDTALGDALTGLANAELDQGEFAKAGERFAESLEIKRALGNLQGVAAQLNGLGSVARQLGEYEKARDYFVEARDILKTLPDARDLGSVVRNIGTISWYRGEYAEAERWFEEALEVMLAADDRRGVASSLDTLGTTALVLGDLAKAKARYLAGLDVLRELGDKPGIAVCLLNLGNVAYHEGDYDAAAERYEESLEMRRQLGDRNGVGTALTNLGTIAYHQKDFDKSRECYSEALVISREVGDQRGAALALHNLGEIAIVGGDFEDAARLCEAALEIRCAIGDARGEAETRTTLGKIASKRGLDDAARPHYIEALGLLDRIGNKQGLIECLELIAAASDSVGALTLFGAVDAALESIGAARSWDGSDRDRREADARAELGDDIFEMTLEVGRSMSLERAVGFATDILSGESDPTQDAVRTSA